ncbi:hypothetical protein RUND412_002299 [Rhizina undulata]
MPRIIEIRQKLHPNEKLRAWAASHTHGGTTKPKSLYILGFRRKNFYIVAGICGAVALVAAIAGGVAVQSSLGKARSSGENAAVGAEIVMTAQSMTLLVTSGGSVFTTTEVTSFETTLVRGGGTMMVETTNERGERTMEPGSLSIILNADGSRETTTLLGSALVTTDSGGSTFSTVLFGAPITTTNANGQVATSTIFNGLTVVTGTDGNPTTSLEISTAPGRGGTASTVTTGALSTNTQSGGSTATGASTGGTTISIGGTASTNSAVESSTTSETTVAETKSTTTGSSSQSTTSSSSSSASTSSSSGGGQSFTGEATFYTPGLGSCGTDATEADFVAALSKVLFDATGVANSNNNPYCGRRALVKAAGGGSRVRKRGYGGIARFGMAFAATNLTEEIATRAVERSVRASRRKKASQQVNLREEPILKSPPPASWESENSHRDGLPRPTVISGVTKPSLENSLAASVTPPPSMVAEMNKRQAGGGGVTVTVIDRCPVCAQYDLDLSPAAFDVIGNEDQGRIQIEWTWLD